MLHVPVLTSNLQELNIESPFAKQPQNINVILRPHQLTLLHKCSALESGDISINTDRIPSNIVHLSSSTTNISAKLKTRIGIIADKVGSGKSNVLLSLIANDQRDVLQKTCMTSIYTYGLNNIALTIDQEKQLFNINLLVIPHNLVSQWASYIQNFFKDPIKYMIISKSKHFERLTSDVIKDQRLLVVTSTFYPRLYQLLQAANIQIKRAIFDEADSINITTVDIVDASFYWFVTASYMNLIYPRGHGKFDRSVMKYVVVADGMKAGGYIRSIFANLQFTNSSTYSYWNIANLIIVKNADSFVDSSLLLPEIQYNYVKCKTPRTINILDGIVDRHIISCLNAGNVEGAIHFINPSHCSSQDNIINILLEKYTKSLNNINTMIDFVTNRMQYDTEQQRATELDRLKKKCDDFNAKITSITSRIKDTNTCCICYETIDNKTIVNCCMNSYCFKCVSTWVSQKHSCPLCKERLDVDKFYVVRPHNMNTDDNTNLDSPTIDEHATNINFDKLKNLEIILRRLSIQNPDNKVLIFSMNDSIFLKIQDMLDNMCRKFKMLKGTNMAITKMVESYKNDDLNTLLVNPENYGSGLNLENTTDMIMLHKLDNEIEKQVIGRAQRYGRTIPLRIWYLLYDNEMRNETESI